MTTICIRTLFTALLFTVLLAGLSAGTGPITVTVLEAQQRVDVLIDGKPVTSYIWPASLKKPVLFPIRTARGTLVTRGFPLEPRPGERVDHPHYAGLWFNHGDVPRRQAESRHTCRGSPRACCAAG